MGAVEALGFVVPLSYFIFIILSTLRLDFCLSTFTGAVAAIELFYMAIFYHRAGSADPAPDLLPSLGAQRHRLDLRDARGCGGDAVAPRIRGQHMASTGRDRVTNLFGQHVSPQVVARLMAEGKGNEERYPPRRRDVRRFSQFYGRREFAIAAGGRRPARRRVCGAGGYPRSPRRHREQVSRRGFLALFGAPLEAHDAAHQAVAAAREMLEANDRVNKATSGRCGSASAFTSAKWSPAISARRGARNTP